jgi:hypothetical protein
MVRRKESAVAQDEQREGAEEYQAADAATARTFGTSPFGCNPLPRFDPGLLFLVDAFTLIFLGVLGALYRDINALCKRVSVIERTINSLAGNEELLEWETRWGAHRPTAGSAGRDRENETEPRQETTVRLLPLPFACHTTPRR